MNTPSRDDQDVITFCQTLNSKRQPRVIPHQPTAYPGAETSSEIIDAHIAKFGGKKTYGWLIKEWPHVWLEADHRAIWENPAGQLVNITSLHWNTEDILFLSDMEALHSKPPIATRYHPKGLDPRIQHAIELMTQHKQIVREFDLGHDIDLVEANKLELELADIKDGLIFEYGSP